MTKSLNREIAERVKNLRDAKGLHQEELANLCGISLRTYVRREAGGTYWTTDELLELSTALGVRMSALVPDDFTPTSIAS